MDCVEGGANERFSLIYSIILVECKGAVKWSPSNLVDMLTLQPQAAASGMHGVHLTYSVDSATLAGSTGKNSVASNYHHALAKRKVGVAKAFCCCC